jgi:flavorubredoxin
LNEWLRAAPQAQAVCSFVGANVMVNDFADRPARVLADDEVLAIGRHRLQFLSTPHVPHCWDAGLFFGRSIARCCAPTSSFTRGTSRR